MEKMFNTIASKLAVHAYPSAQRNIGPIHETLSPLLPDTGLVLEIAAGSGYHSAVLAATHTNLIWQPTDQDTEAQVKMTRMVEDAELSNLRPPLVLDAMSSDWPVDEAAAILCCNMIHIAPWSVAKGLFSGVGRTLLDGGALFLYGPFKIDGQHTTKSNKFFEQGLRDQNPEWGVRDTVDVNALAQGAGLVFENSNEMPANNFLRVYRKG
jgi:hypothetical protein